MPDIEKISFSRRVRRWLAKHRKNVIGTVVGLMMFAMAGLYVYALLIVLVAAWGISHMFAYAIVGGSVFVFMYVFYMFSTLAPPPVAAA